MQPRMPKLKSLRRRLLSAALVTANVFIAIDAPAAVIRSPASATAASSLGQFTPELAINQAGLFFHPFNSGVDDFEAYLATDPTHTTDGVGAWYGTNSNNGPTLWLELDDTYSVSGMALWTGYHDFSAETLSVWLSADGMTYLKVANQVSVNGLAHLDETPAQRFDWVPLSVRYAFLQLDCASTALACGIAEVAFRTESLSVPEPGSLSVLASGAVALWLRRRGQRSSAATSPAGASC